MNCKEVLENQIKRLEEVQEQVLKGIIERKENAAYTQTTLSLIASTSARIESLVASIIRLQEEPTVTKYSHGNSNGQNNIEKQVQSKESVKSLKEAGFINNLANSIGNDIVNRLNLANHDNL